MAKKPIRFFLVYTADSALQVCGTTLSKAVKGSGIDETKTPIVAVIEAHGVAPSSLNVSALILSAIVIRNPNYQAGPQS